MIGIYDTNDILITPLVETALLRPDLIEIKNRTLDGQWHIQMIGQTAYVLDVTAYVNLEQKRILNDKKITNDEIKVIFDGEYYLGIIDDRIEYDRKALSGNPMFKTTFTLLVLDKGVDL